MKLPDSKTLRAAGIALPLLMTGCAIVPDGGVVYQSGYRAPAYTTGYSSGHYSTYGTGYYARPPAPPVYISRPPAIIVRPSPGPVVVLPAPRLPGYGYHGGDRHHGHGGHHGHRGDHDRGGHGHGHGRDGR